MDPPPNRMPPQMRPGLRLDSLTEKRKIPTGGASIVCSGSRPDIKTGTFQFSTSTSRSMNTRGRSRAISGPRLFYYFFYLFFIFYTRERQRILESAAANSIGNYEDRGNFEPEAKIPTSSAIPMQRREQQVRRGLLDESGRREYGD